MTKEEKIKKWGKGVMESVGITTSMTESMKEDFMADLGSVIDAVMADAVAGTFKALTGILGEPEEEGE